MNKKMLWPTDIYSFKNVDIDNDKIKEIILEKEKTEPSRKISNMGGWQSHGELISEDCFSEIKNFLFECASSIKNEIYKDDVKIFLAQSWANVNRYGHSNINHVHPNSHWSCAYYITETYTAPLYFIDPRARSQMFSAYDLHNENNKYYDSVGPEKSQPGDALFFPSWLEHGVAINSTNNPRISISCNFQVTSR
tara:strand:+ start:321 stop:902 length:582 start_codon:yes stop_codon:yes gene_type:complete